MNKGAGIGLLAVFVLVIFSVNKVYENHHHLSTPLILEVDEADIVMVKPPPASTKLTLPPDNLGRTAKRYLPQSLLQQFQQFNPWLGPQKKIVTRRAVVYAKKVTSGEENGELGTRRALRFQGTP